MIRPHLPRRESSPAPAHGGELQRGTFAEGKTARESLESEAITFTPSPSPNSGRGEHEGCLRARGPSTSLRMTEKTKSDPPPQCADLLPAPRIESGAGGEGEKLGPAPFYGRLPYGKQPQPSAFAKSGSTKVASRQVPLPNPPPRAGAGDGAFRSDGEAAP